MRVADLRPSDRNPRTISTGRLENLKRSLQEDRAFLDARPLLVNSYPGRENIVIAGNMRLRAAQELGWDEVPVLLVSLPPDIEAQWNLKDNNQWGDYVAEDLAEMLTELNSRGVDVEILGFGKDEVERLLALVTATAARDDDDFDPTPPSLSQTSPGDLFVLGPHRLVCGDSREPSTWNLLMQPTGGSGVSADAMWTDPPYGVDLAGAALPSRRSSVDLAIVGDLPGEVAPLLASVFSNTDQWLKPGAPFYVAGPHGRMAVPFVQEIERVGWHMAQTLVWVKNGFVPGRADYHYQHEAIYYGWKPGATHVWLHAVDQATVIDDEPDLSKMSRAKLIAVLKELRAARRTDALREDKSRHNDLHPTMKPTGLIQRCLGNSTRRGDLVIDPFAGSGSTIVAAHVMSRRVAAIELEPRFCDVIVRRWLELDSANTALRVREGQTEPVGGNL